MYLRTYGYSVLTSRLRTRDKIWLDLGRCHEISGYRLCHFVGLNGQYLPASREFRSLPLFYSSLDNVRALFVREAKISLKRNRNLITYIGEKGWV